MPRSMLGSVITYDFAYRLEGITIRNSGWSLEKVKATF